MTSVVRITRLFAEARNNCMKVAGTLKYNHAVAFKEYLLNICLQIAFEGTNAGDPSGAILEDTCYRVTVASNTPYNRQVVARANFDPDLQSDAPVRHAKEENWAASIRNQSRKRAIKCSANDYLLRLVDPTWLRLLKNDTTFFTRVTPVEILSELTKASGSLERVDTVDLLVSLTQLW